MRTAVFFVAVHSWISSEYTSSSDVPLAGSSWPSGVWHALC